VEAKFKRRRLLGCVLLLAQWQLIACGLKIQGFFLYPFLNCQYQPELSTWPSQILVKVIDWILLNTSVREIQNSLKSGILLVASYTVRGIHRRLKYKQTRIGKMKSRKFGKLFYNLKYTRLRSLCYIITSHNKARSGRAVFLEHVINLVTG
jgi:hypothetical protein